MTEENKSPEVHFYDGIEEHNHPIPGWFSALFLGTLLAGVLYYNYYELWGGPSLVQEYDKAMVAQRLLQSELESKAPKASEQELLALSKDSENHKKARAVFIAKCVSCHGAEAQGGIGPNLVDAYWIHGGKITDIRDTIANGVLDKGMPPWGSLLESSEVNSLAGYIRSLQGSKPVGAKQAQGVLVKLE